MSCKLEHLQIISQHFFFSFCCRLLVVLLVSKFAVTLSHLTEIPFNVLNFRQMAMLLNMLNVSKDWIFQLACLIEVPPFENFHSDYLLQWCSLWLILVWLASCQFAPNCWVWNKERGCLGNFKCYFWWHSWANKVSHLFIIFLWPS